MSGTATANQERHGSVQEMYPSRPRPLHQRGRSGAGDAIVNNNRRRRGGVKGFHESKIYLLPFASSDIYRQLRHINAKRAEAMEGLLAFVYDRFNDGFSRTDLTRIFIALGGDSKGGGG